jgi:hypothetical protein
VAVTDRVVPVPVQTDVDPGCTEMDAGWFTVTVAVRLSTVPQVPVTRTQ